MVAGRGAPPNTRRDLRLLRRATLVVARSIGLVLLDLPSIRNGNRRAGGAVMSDAQRQALCGSPSDPAPPGGGSLQGPGFRANPAFISVLSSRRSGHTLSCARASRGSTGCKLHPPVPPTTAYSLKRPPWGHGRRSLTAPVRGVRCTPPSTCGFRLLGAAYGGVWAASGRGGAANAPKALEESPESRTRHVRHASI